MIVRVLPLLRKLFDSVETISLVVLNTILQLNGLFKKKSKFHKQFRETNLFFPLRIIGKALSLLLKIDCVVSESTFYNKTLLIKEWKKYKEVFAVVKNDPEKVGVDKAKVRLLERIIVKIDKAVLTGNSLLTLLNFIQKETNLAIFDESSSIKEIRANKYLKELFDKFFKTNFLVLESRVKSNVETREEDLLPELLCIFAFSLPLFKKENKIIWKQFWSLQKKSLAIYVHRFICIRICDFLKRYCMPKKVYSSLDPKDINGFTTDVLVEERDQFNKIVISIYKSAITWIIQVSSRLTTMHVFNKPKGDEIKSNYERRVKLVIKG